MPDTVWKKILLFAALFCLATAPLAAQLEQKSKEDQETLPLKTTRTVEFTTDEGTWMSIDISPDGRTIIFDLLGDLYVLPIAGGEARRITSGPAYDKQPRFSPDGGHVVFISDGSGSDNLWLMRPDGSEPRAVTKENKLLLGSPAWSPDGNYLAVRKGKWSVDLNELWLYHKDGGGGVQLTKREGPTSAVAGPAFSPDGKYVYLSSSSQWRQPNADLGPWQVRRLSRDTGELITLTDKYGGGLRPALSPDGRYLIYGSRHDANTGLIIRELQSGTERWLVYPIDRDEQEGFACNDLLPGYDFTPDGQAIVLSFGGKIHKIDINNRSGALIPFTAQVRQELAPPVFFARRVEQGPVQLRQVRRPNQSYDGKRLVFSAVGNIWLTELPVGKPRRLTQGNESEYAASLSPDGRWIAYVTWSDKGGGYLYKVATDGGSPQRLSQIKGFYHNPAWSPDGRKIAFMIGSAQAWLAENAYNDVGLTQEIRWISADGGQSHPIVVSPLPPLSHRGPVQQPTFSSDGQRIYYLDYEPASRHLIVRSVRLDGSDKRIHLKLVGATQAVASPDEKWVAFTIRGNAYVTAIPRTGEALTIDPDSPAIPIRALTNEGGDDLRWEDAGETLTWGFTNRFYRIKLTDAWQAQKGEEVKPTEFTINLQVPRHAPQGKIAFRGARIITLRGDEVIPTGDIVVENNRIKAVGPSGNVEIPADATVINVKGKTIIPGLIDLHDHFYPAREIFHERPWELAARLAYGVTTSFDPEADNNTIFGHAEMVEAGTMLGPRIYSTGEALHTRGAKIESLEDARHIARRYKRHGAISLKEYVRPRRVERQWLAMAAQEEGLNITADAGGDLAKEMTHVLDGYTGFEHNLPVVPVYRDVIGLLVGGKTYYDPTLVIELVGPRGANYFRQNADLHEDAKLRRFTPHELIDRKNRRRLLVPEEDYRFVQAAQAAAAVIRKGGGRAVTGGHGEQPGLATHWEMWIFAMGGLSPLEALRAATLYGAESLGLQADLGSLEAGKLADLVVLNSNPLENIRNTTDIVYVMKNGDLFEGETLNQIWPVKKAFGKFLWQLQDEDLE